MDEITEKDFIWLDDFFDQYLPSYKEVWLFGTGAFAQSFSRFLNICNVEISGFVVTNPVERTVNEKPVKSVDEFKVYWKESQLKEKSITLLLTLSSRYYGEVYPRLMVMGKDLCMINEGYLKLAKERCGCIDEIILSMPLTNFCSGISCYGCSSAVPAVEQRCPFT